ncbi:MAG: hypothetical protein R3D30_08415 [Hyphomicrobiales bacterium]
MAEAEAKAVVLLDQIEGLAALQRQASTKALLLINGSTTVELIRGEAVADGQEDHGRGAGRTVGAPAVEPCPHRALHLPKYLA